MIPQIDQPFPSVSVYISAHLALLYRDALITTFLNRIPRVSVSRSSDRSMTLFN